MATTRAGTHPNSALRLFQVEVASGRLVPDTRGHDLSALRAVVSGPARGAVGPGDGCRASHRQGRVGREMAASSAASRLRNAKANHVGDQAMLRQHRYLMASGRLTASGTAPPATYSRAKVATFCR